MIRTTCGSHLLATHRITEVCVLRCSYGQLMESWAPGINDCADQAVHVKI